MVSPPPLKGGAELLTFDQKVSRVDRKKNDQMMANVDGQVSVEKRHSKTVT